MPLLAVAFLLIAADVAGLVVHARAGGRFGMLGQWGLCLGMGGGAILAVALTIQALFYDGDFPYMPTVVVPAGLAMVLGFLLFAITILRELPRWAGAFLIVGTLVLLGVNDQDERILLAIPFGLAWMSIGYVLWSGTADLPNS
jgi:hypothetical protein